MEAMLHTAGVIGRLGRVEQGTSVSIILTTRKKEKLNFTCSRNVEYDGIKINIVDIPVMLILLVK
jgi:hypothetical protein